MRDHEGTYRGILEVNQDVTAIRALEGDQAFRAGRTERMVPLLGIAFGIVLLLIASARRPFTGWLIRVAFLGSAASRPRAAPAPSSLV